MFINNNKFFIHKNILCNNFKNVMEIIFIKKLVLNFGVKGAVQIPKRVLSAGLALNFITTNKSLPRVSTKSVMVLKVREGMVVGCKSTLRKNFIYIFLSLLVKKLFLKSFENKRLKIINTQECMSINCKYFMREIYFGE